VFIALAILALVLVYPAATPSAATPGSRDVPTIQIITPHSGDETVANSGDDGDADDLAGMKNRREKPVGGLFPTENVIQARLAIKVWQMYFFGLGLHR
jgi:hypothetical protein